jgi:hypothetical protein
MTTLSRSALGLARINDCGGGEICLTDPVDQDLCVYRGDTGYFMIVVTEADMTTPIDVTTATWQALIKVSADDKDPVGAFVVTMHPGEVNVVDCTLLPAISAQLAGTYFYDVEMTLDGKVTTLVAGELTVDKDVSWP